MDTASLRTKRNESSPAKPDGSSYASGSADVPLAGYAASLGVFTSLFGGLLAYAVRRRRLPRTIAPADVLLLGVATHEITRLVTRDAVTSPLRAPFARYEGRAGAGEVREHPRGQGGKRVVGELLTCPFCAAPWVAAALTTALVWKPPVARTVMSMFAAAAASDFLEQLYSYLRHAPRAQEKA